MMESLKNLQKTESWVIRDGKPPTKVNIVDLVVGDVVELNLGEKIPADLRIVSGEVEVDNSALTGEIKPVKIKTKPGKKGLTNTMEAENIVFFSTNNKKGTATGIVSDIGPNTFMGKIADLASSAEPEKTTLQRELDEFIKLIAIIAVSLGVLFFILGVIIRYPIITNFIFAIGIIVANVPEGLGYAVTSILALVAQKMLARKVFVKNLQSVETLGSITCICSDKTGTLTQNKMTVVHLWYDTEIKKTKKDQPGIRLDGNDLVMNDYDDADFSFEVMKFVGVCGSYENFENKISEDFEPYTKKKKEFDRLSKADKLAKTVIDPMTGKPSDDPYAFPKSLVQTEWDLYYKSNVQDRVTNPGNASEAAMIKFFEGIEQIDTTRLNYPPHVVQGNEVAFPFNSDVKCSFKVRLTKVDGVDHLQVAVKGAPEVLITRCKTYLYKGRELPIDKRFEDEFKIANTAFALKGERVIGYAYKRFDPKIYNTSCDFPRTTNEEAINSILSWNLCFVGIVAIEDPPREGVKDAIRICHEAGVKVVMVTGDQTLTAASIANQIGIIKNLDETPEIIMKNEGLATIEEAEKKSNVVFFNLGNCH